MTTIADGKVLSIVIPVFNKWNYTKSCLKDLHQLPSNHEIIIIDNGSTDETQEELAKIADPKIKIIRNEENVFHSKACNQGYAIASADVVLFMNNDIRVKNNHSNWTNPIIWGVDFRWVDLGLVGPTMGQLDSKLNFVKEANERLNGNSYIGGWCLASSKNILKKLEAAPNQVWNENYPMYFNDTDLSFRARKLGIPLLVIPLPDVVHFGKVSAAQLNINKLYNEGRKVFLQDWKK